MAGVRVDGGDAPAWAVQYGQGCAEQLFHRGAFFQRGESLTELAQRRLLNVRKRIVDPPAGLSFAKARAGVAGPLGTPSAGGVKPVGVLVSMIRDTDMLQVARAGASSPGFPSQLHRRQRDRDKNADNGDNDDELDQCKARLWTTICCVGAKSTTFVRKRGSV